MLEWQDEEDFAPVALPELVEVVRKQSFVFDCARGAKSTVVLATGIDASCWVRAALEVDVHEVGAWDPGCVLFVTVEGVGLDPLNPSVEFPGPSSLATVSIQTGDPVPQYLISSLALSPALLRLSVTWTQGPVAATGPHTISLSVRVVGRPR